MSPTVIVANDVSCQCGYYVLLFCEVKTTVIVLCNYSGSAHHSVPNAVQFIDTYCFCVSFLFLLFVCLHISSFFFYLNGEIKMYNIQFAEIGVYSQPIDNAMAGR